MKQMKQRLIGTSFLFTLAVAPTTVVANSAETPNFLLFLADDCTFKDIGCYGSKDSITPNIDNFAKQGIRFDKGYQAASMSSPTRHNLYSAMWPVKSGAYPNHAYANDDIRSVVHHLHTAGYKVALTGKLHVAPESVFPFDLYAPSVKGELPHDEIEKFIAECNESGTPFCIFVTSHDPHYPWTKGDASQFQLDQVTLPPIYVDTSETRKLYVDYLAEINYMDMEFGRVLGVLEREQLVDNTVVFFLSEQGNSLPFAKWTCYDVGVHSAIIARWPGVVKPNTTSDAIVEYVDIVPTFVDIAGADLVVPVDGESFKDVLMGKSKSHKKYTFSLQTTKGINDGSPHYGIRSVCDGRYRYIVNLTPEIEFANMMTVAEPFLSWKRVADSGDTFAREIVYRYQHRPACELYDVEQDSYCMNNIYGEKGYDKVAKRLASALQEWMTECGDLGQETELEALDHFEKNRTAVLNRNKTK